MDHELHEALVDALKELPTPPDDLTVWHIRQALARELKKKGGNAMTGPDSCNEGLYELPAAFLHVSREADQGWNYALYRKSELCSYRLDDGGYIDGRVDEPIDDVAAFASQELEIEDAPVPADKTFLEFSELIDDEPDALIRGVKVFLSPELKKEGFAALPDDVAAEVSEQIDRRLARPILLIHDPVKGYGMHQIDPACTPEGEPFEVELPDCTGLLYLDRSAGDTQVGDYDLDWAREIWLDPVRIDRIGGKIVVNVG